MINQILHKYIILDKHKNIKHKSDWIDVSNLTIGQLNKISRGLDKDYPNSWYVEIRRVEA